MANPETTEFRLTRLEKEFEDFRKEHYARHDETLAILKEHSKILLRHDHQLEELTRVSLETQNQLCAFRNDTEQRFKAMEAYMDSRFNSLEVSVDQRFDKVDQRFDKVESDVSELKSDVSEIKNLLKEKDR